MLRGDAGVPWARADIPADEWGASGPGGQTVHLVPWVPRALLSPLDLHHPGLNGVESSEQVGL